MFAMASYAEQSPWVTPMGRNGTVCLTSFHFPAKSGRHTSKSTFATLLLAASFCDRILNAHIAWYIAAECLSHMQGLLYKLWHNQLICPL